MDILQLRECCKYNIAIYICDHVYGAMKRKCDEINGLVYDVQL